jgi:hypothetical protein
VTDSGLPSIRVKLPCQGEREFQQRYAPPIAAKGLPIPTANVRPVGSRIRLTLELKSGEVVSGEAVVESHAKAPKQAMVVKFVSLDEDSIVFALGAAPPVAPAGEGAPPAKAPPRAPPPAPAKAAPAPPPAAPALTPPPGPAKAAPAPPPAAPALTPPPPAPATAAPATPPAAPALTPPPWPAKASAAPRPPPPTLTPPPPAPPPEAAPPPRPAAPPPSPADEDLEDLYGPPESNDPLGSDPELAALADSAPSAAERDDEQDEPQVRTDRMPGPAGDEAPPARSRRIPVVAAIAAAVVVLGAAGAWALLGRSRPPAPAPAAAQVDRVAPLVAAADRDLDDGRLAGGPDSALARLLEARALAPEDPRVRERLKLLADALEALAARALDRGHPGEAQVHLAAAEQAAPDRPSLREKRARLEALAPRSGDVR